MAVFLAAAAYGLVLAALIAAAWWLSQRARGGQSRGFPWVLLAALWLPASAAVFGLIYLTWES